MKPVGFPLTIKNRLMRTIITILTVHEKQN